MSPKDFTQVQTTMTNQQYCLKWNNHQVNLLRAFDRLLQTESFTDVTLACEGRSLRAHKVVLSACSSYFETLFEEHPDKSPIIILKDIKFAHVSQLVNFMYRGEINITQDMLTGLLRTAETLKIKGLAEVSGEQSTASTAAAAAAAAAAATAAAQQFGHLQSSFRIGSSVPQLVPAHSSALTAALNAPVSAPNLAPLAAFLNPEVGLDDRRINLLKRRSQDDDAAIAEASSSKILRKQDIKTESPNRSPSPPSASTPNHNNHHHHNHNSSSTSSNSHHQLHHSTSNNSSSNSGVNTIASATSNNPSSSLNQLRLGESLQQMASSSQVVQQQMALQPSSAVQHSSHKQQQQQQQQQSSALQQSKTPKGQQLPTSPSQPILTPIPHELTVNAQQELPDFLQGYSVFRLNDYLGFRTRQQFWEEPAVRRIMEGIKNKEIDMKSAAEILGVSYGTLYGRYREVFGYLKHAWVNKPGRSPSSSQKERTLWDEARAQDLIQKVLAKELSLTAAAVRLGVDYNTFFAHLTDNGKNQARVALLTGSSASNRGPQARRGPKGRPRSGDGTLSSPRELRSHHEEEEEEEDEEELKGEREEDEERFEGVEEEEEGEEEEEEEEEGGAEGYGDAHTEGYEEAMSLGHDAEVNGAVGEEEEEEEGAEEMEEEFEGEERTEEEFEGVDRVAEEEEQHQPDISHPPPEASSSPSSLPRLIGAEVMERVN